MNKHFYNRLLDRYGIVCTEELYQDFLDQIFYYRAPLVGYKTPTNGIYKVRYKKEFVYVAHLKQLGTTNKGILTTALDEDILIRNGLLKVRSK